MKKIHLLRVVMSSLFLSLAVACGDTSPEPATEDVPGQELAGTWAVSEANDVTGPAADQFTGFSISITANASAVSYTTTGGGDPLVFPEQGTFIVEATDNFEDGAEVLREPDNVPVSVRISEDGDVMDMTFTIDIGTTATNGRMAGINGEYNFTLNRQGSSN